MCGVCLFFFQAEDGIRDLVRSRGLGDVYKRQIPLRARKRAVALPAAAAAAAAVQCAGAARGGAGLSLIHI